MGRTTYSRKKFLEWVSGLLREHKMTRYQLAEKCGITEHAVALWYSSTAESVQTGTIMTAAHAFGVPLPDLSIPHEPQVITSIGVHHATDSGILSASELIAKLWSTIQTQRLEIVRLTGELSVARLQLSEMDKQSQTMLEAVTAPSVATTPAVIDEIRHTGVTVPDDLATFLSTNP